MGEFIGKITSAVLVNGIRLSVSLPIVDHTSGIICIFTALTLYVTNLSIWDSSPLMYFSSTRRAITLRAAMDDSKEK